MSGRLARLAIIGTAAGVFSGLFGVGGGTIVVPLLILWLSYGEREATGTSLAAIAIIASVGALAQGLHGNVYPLAGAIMAVPAALGAVAGTALQQRVPEHTVSYLFAFVLVISAGLLVAQ